MGTILGAFLNKNGCPAEMIDNYEAHVKALGYKPGVYASTTWFRKRLDMSQLSNYYIWNAHYNVASSPIACNMWQGTCTARIPGYGGQIDVNISYMG